MRRNCCSSLSSLTEFAVGLTEEGCWASAAGASETSPAKASDAKTSRRPTTSVVMPLPPLLVHLSRKRGEGGNYAGLDRDLFAVRGFPAPCAGAVAALHRPFLVDLGDDLAVAGQQRFGRAHLRAHRQLALGETIGAVFIVFLRRVVGLGSAGAIGAFVHLAARAEIADAGILRRAERAGVEAIAAADAQVLGVQHHGVRRGIEAVHRAYRRARRVGAVHAGHRHRALAGLAVVDGHHAAAVDAPRHLVLVLAGGDAGVAFDAAIGVAQEFHSSHGAASYAARIWHSVTLGSCMLVAGSYP